MSDDGRDPTNHLTTRRPTMLQLMNDYLATIKTVKSEPTKYIYSEEQRVTLQEYLDIVKGISYVEGSHYPPHKQKMIKDNFVLLHDMLTHRAEGLKMVDDGRKSGRKYIDVRTYYPSRDFCLAPVEALDIILITECDNGDQSGLKLVDYFHGDLSDEDILDTANQYIQSYLSR
jgi:hypothetical protein